LADSIKQNLDRARRYFQDGENYLGRIATNRKELLRLEGQDPTQSVLEELNDVLQEGSWINPVLEKADGTTYLYLNTRKDVVVIYKNKKAGIDLEINLGQFGVKMDLNSFQVWVIPYKNNRSVDRWGDGVFYHPHVDQGGSICWGDAREKVTAWRSTMAIGNILKMLYSLLFNYNDGNPYVHLPDFQGSRRKGRTTDFLKHPERKKNPNIVSSTSAATTQTVTLATGTSSTTY
jgi:hypothetical protein